MQGKEQNSLKNNTFVNLAFPRLLSVAEARGCQ